MNKPTYIHCKRIEHRIYQCFELHGYSDWFIQQQNKLANAHFISQVEMKNAETPLDMHSDNSKIAYSSELF